MAFGSMEESYDSYLMKINMIQLSDKGVEGWDRPNHTFLHTTASQVVTAKENPQRKNKNYYSSEHLNDKS